MDNILLFIFVGIGIFILLEIIFTKKGKYVTNSYKINPYIDKDECIELLICDPYIKKKSFFVSYKYTEYLEKKGDIYLDFIKIPIFHIKPRIQDVYIDREKIT